MAEDQNKIIYPHIVFRIGETLYCIDSKYVTTIVQLPAHEPVPDMPNYFTGLFLYRNETVYMLDLRTLLNQPTMQQKFADFQQMLEQRQDDHRNWIMELTRCVDCGEDFSLATDPHECKLGKWYDQFHTSNQTLKFHMNKLDAPHKQLHQMAAEIAHATQRNPDRAQHIIQEISARYVPQVLDILENAKEIFSSQMYHEMALLLNTGDGNDVPCSIVVDEVFSVEELTDMGTQNALKILPASPYLMGVKKSTRVKDMIIEVNAPEILQLVNQITAERI